MADLPMSARDPQSADRSSAAMKKRTRVKLSCTSCRNKKLRCDRIFPCTNCQRRGEAEKCAYVGPGPQSKARHERSSPKVIQDRLQHLENLVMSLAQKNSGDSGVNAMDADQSLLTPDQFETNDSPPDSGTLLVKNEEISYIDSSDWRAILQEIHGVREHFLDNEVSDEEDSEEALGAGPSPALLLGMARPITKDEVLADIPSRSVADRLVSKFLKSAEPALVALHVPTFQREYEEFWHDPYSKPFTWIALLFDVFALSISWIYRGEQALSSDLVNSAARWDLYRTRAAQCLVKANYLVPGRYKCEALLLYTVCEFYRSRDAQIGVSYLLSMTIRLAMRMGYHRDSKHFPNLPVWEGEMRRRVWACLCQIDTLVSFQVGCPRTIRPCQFDTELPSNLHDTEFDQTTTQLPESRSDDGEFTWCTYVRAKARLMAAFGEIVDLAFSRDTASYDDEILAIDRRLEDAHKALPTILRMHPINQSITVPTAIIFRRYSLEMLYQQARQVLHRRYMGQLQSKFAYSRSVCLAAATQTLRYNVEIWTESKPGGLLCSNEYFANAFQTSDFVLSAMILCLELSQSSSEDSSKCRLEEQERMEILTLLETTHQIFEEGRRKSVDTHRAFVALSIMLGKVHPQQKDRWMQNVQRPTPPSEDQVVQQMGFATISPDVQSATNSGSIAVSQAMFSTYSDGVGSTSSLDVIGDMLGTPAQLDWGLYDIHVSGYATARQDSSWFEAGEESLPLTMDLTAYPDNSYVMQFPA
ncbi:Fungal Zn(2)-Cys(6) binuclear cluster domain-containing protein [Penicillium ucsense]|uniref:Fungal Zn(2)-Cys(6) binuclear cluster domain-containing protein n=1 Tax=Penicillium ucsense TaxID=2839758 RepID=A0A8J8VZQ4_9EURO|nr:Fungal Zn(2)-Cys(6) binuclear cluster domain-containing protein [Penicillium ucsense]KAF7734425.1 Fungal Zn(2)-Cys(6) binuclear cluster domain-containing protein [Penicillium ucsense]